MEFSQIVKSLRLERGWSQQEVADRAGADGSRTPKIIVLRDYVVLRIAV